MVKITDNTRNVFNELNQKASIFLRLMADEIIKISTPRTPKKTGRMRMDVNRQVLGLSGKVKWGKNYAKYQETKQFINYTTGGTGPHFAEYSVKDGAKNTRKIANSAGLI